MSSSVSEAFEAGSGVSSSVLKITIQLISSGVILMVFAWVMAQIFSAYQSDRIKVAQAVAISINASVILCLLISVVLW